MKRKEIVKKSEKNNLFSKEIQTSQLLKTETLKLFFYWAGKQILSN